MFSTVAHCCLIQAKTLLKGFKGLSTGLADLADDRVGGRAASNAHLKVVTISMPRLWLGCHTLAILIQLSAAVSSSDFQGCLHLQANSSADQSGRRDPPFPVSGCYGGAQPRPPGLTLPVVERPCHSSHIGPTFMAVSCFAFRLTAYPGGGPCNYFRSVSYFSLFTSGLWWSRLVITGSRTSAVIEQPGTEHQSWFPVGQIYSRSRCHFPGWS